MSEGKFDRPESLDYFVSEPTPGLPPRTTGCRGATKLEPADPPSPSSSILPFMILRPAMITVPDPDLSPAPSRYYAADFHKLTNRRASSPSTPDFALPDRVVPARARLNHATADRRAFFSNDAAPCVMQGTPKNSRTRQGSGSSVKEEAGGIDWEPLGSAMTVETPKTFAPGESPLERLPVEVLDEVIAQLALDSQPSAYAPRNVDLISCLLTSRTVHVATINTLYSHITVPHSSIFSKFLSHVAQCPGLGTIVKRLDLSHFTSIGLGRSRQVNSEVQNMTSKTLHHCLELTPAIQEVLLQENLDDDIDENVLCKLFYGLPKLRAVDFCASSSKPFAESFTSAVTGLVDVPINLNIRRLGLHECFTLPSNVFETLLPRLPYLTHLDVSHTRITDNALASIPESASLSHLNLGRCTQISGHGVVEFLTNHPAAKNLVFLNLSCDIARYRLLREDNVERLLPAIPTTLKSLNLNGAKIRRWHTPLLLPLTKHLEELSLASADLSVQDINSFFGPVPPPTSPTRKSVTPEESSQPWTPPTLHYLDLSSIPAITQSSLFSTSCTLLSPKTSPLEVIELGDKAISSLRECRNTNKRLGWVVKELGRRGWYVRDSNAAGGNQGGRRSWKMGAMWWGMRKCPVAWGEVGGLYGHYMFKK
ncbi:MAG: hypothetical protein L6R41_002374 [Letrouitia leprolyta]|nr:MAG: hypothetical protein L6R41_002374 [Letrouitia leprolyta]